MEAIEPNHTEEEEKIDISPSMVKSPMFRSLRTFEV